MKAALPLLCLLLTGPALTTVKAREPAVEKAAELADKRIRESSGLARSLRHPGILWTHNDSGGEPCLYAIDTLGKTRAKVRIPKAAAFDWEDMTQGLDEEGNPWLFVGDIGDNFKIRPSLQIYRIPEPDLPADAEKEMLSAEPEIWHVAYPRGRYNAECLMWDPRSRLLYIVTKEENGDSLLFKIPPPKDLAKTTTMERVASLTFPSKARPGKQPSMACQVTSGDFSPDGSRLMISTYNFLHEWRIRKGQSLEEALQAPATIIQAPLMRQLEAACYDRDNLTLWMTSEQLPTPLYRIRR